MCCNRQVLVSVFIPSVFAAPIGQSFFQPVQLRHKHEIEVSELVTNSPFQGLKRLFEDRKGNNHTDVHGGRAANGDGICHGGLHSAR